MTPEPYVPIEDLAKHFTVSVSTIRTWVRQGLIPKSTYIKVGNTYRFSVSKVVAVLTAHTDEPELMQESTSGSTDSAPADDVTDETPVQLELDFNNPDEDA